MIHARRAALEIIPQLFADAKRAVRWVENFDHQIRCSTEKCLAGFRRPRHAGGTGETDIRATQIPGAHPAAEVWAAHHAKAVLDGVSADVCGECRPDCAVFHASATQTKLGVDQLAFAAVVLKSHQLLFCPSRSSGLHDEMENGQRAGEGKARVGANSI